MLLRLESVADAAEDIKRFEFRDPGGRDLPPFESGAHLRLRVREKLWRRYSLISDPSDRRCYEIAVLRHDSGAGSTFLHRDVAAGDLLEADEPVNGFPLVETEHTLLIAGGIGITPILSHARQLRALGRSFEVHYSARTRSRLAFQEELRSIAGSGCHFYCGAEGERLDLATLLRGSADGRRVYVCGPSRLLTAVRKTAASLGWPAARVHFESYGAEWNSDDLPVQLHLTLSGLTIDVPVGQTLLEAMESQGVWVPYDCRRGECHMCMTNVVSGDPIHRDQCLDETERATAMTPCVSWARGGHLSLEL